MNISSKETHLKVSKIKDIWATYFDKYDSVNLAVEKQFEDVNNTFVEWKEKVLKPLNMSEARLFTVEVSLKEIEDKIFKNFAHSKDILKKLVFALEQENISCKESIEVNVHNKGGYTLNDGIRTTKSK